MSGSYHHGNLREALLGRAIEILNDCGVERLSLRALARDVGVSHAAPVRHFATKADLLSAIAIEGVESLLNATEAARDQPAGLCRLRAMSLAYVTWAKQNSAFHRVIRNPDVMRHKSEGVSKLLEEFAGMQKREICLAQEQGWRADCDPEVLFLHLVSLTAGTAIVVTDQVYSAPISTSVSLDSIEASLALFFEERAECP